MLVALGGLALMALRRVIKAVGRLEKEQISPALGRVNTILEDVKDVTTTVREKTERIDPLVRATINTIGAFFNRNRHEHKAPETTN